MAADDVALAWVRLHDEDVRDQVRGGELSALGELSLTDEEGAMVRRMADEGPEPSAAPNSAFAEAHNYAKGQLSAEVLDQVLIRAAEHEAQAEVSGFAFDQFFPALSTNTSYKPTGAVPPTPLYKPPTNPAADWGAGSPDGCY